MNPTQTIASFTPIATGGIVVPAKNPVSASGIDSRFVELTPVGLGGDCEVFQCFDLERGHTVALKRLHPHRSNRNDDRTRFLQEPHAMHQLASTEVPRIHDVFPERMYKPYFTMEMVEGLDLRQVLQELGKGNEPMERSFPLSRLIETVCESAAGLSVAHQRGWVHRDIKPENIMITHSGDVKIVDWGSALCVQESASESPNQSRANFPSDRRRNGRLTKHGQRPGTPLYMAPEQTCIGDTVDQQSDVFGLGAVLYDALALTTLKRGRTHEEVFAFTRRGDFQKPSVAGTRPSIPPEVEQVCMKAVAVNREERYSTMDDFRQELLAASRTKRQP